MAIQSRNKVNVNFSMSSLTDIVFLLLIFFIILSTFVSPYGEEVDLPQSSGIVTNPPTLVVTIKKDLSFWLDGRQYPDQNAMEAALIEIAANSDKPQITLAVDKAVPTGETIAFLGMCKRNDFGIVIKTEPPKKK